MRALQSFAIAMGTFVVLVAWLKLTFAYPGIGFGIVAFGFLWGFIHHKLKEGPWPK